MSRSVSRSPRLVRAGRLVGLGLGVLALAWALAGTVSAQHAEAASSSDLNQQLEEVRADLKEVRSNLQKAEAARKAALGDLAALDQSLDYARKAYNTAHGAYAKAAARLAELQAQLADLMARLDSNQQELTKTEGQLAEQQDTLCERMVSIYKSGGGLSYLSVLLGGEDSSLVEVVERFRLLSTIADQDARLVVRIGDLKEQIVEQRRSLEQERGRVAALEADQAAVTCELQAADRECKASLKEVEAALAAKKSLLKSIEKSQAAWARQEDQLLADSDRIATLLKKSQSASPTKAGKGVLSWPVPGPVTSGFGYRIHPIFKVKKLHTGIDLSGAIGDPIKAAAAGQVIFAGWRGGYGKCVIIDHNGGLATLYGHLSTIVVSVGQVVQRGATIGKVGSTGYSTGPHLHFEVRVNGTPVDPMDYL